jgi:hypothetical protein
VNEELKRLLRILNQQWYFRTGNEGYLRNKYGITINDLQEMMVNQDGYCDSCDKDLDTSSRWAVDHNRETGRVRGLICYSCNTGIGKLGGNISGLTKAINYLRKHGET